MQAIILNSGEGKRLKPLTNQLPKALIEVRGKALIDYQLEGLVKYGITKVIITTGPFKEQLEQRDYPIDVTFVHNPKYRTTNNIYTLWLTRNLINDDVLLLHGDLLFDGTIVEDLIRIGGNHVLISKGKGPSKDFKALIEGDRITEIGVGLFGHSCMPMYYFLKEDFRQWLNKVDSFVSMGRVDCYAEDALNRILDKVKLEPLYSNKFCMEIDTLKDLEEAQKWVF